MCFGSLMHMPAGPRAWRDLPGLPGASPGGALPHRSGSMHASPGGASPGGVPPQPSGSVHVFWDLENKHPGRLDPRWGSVGFRADRVLDFPYGAWKETEGLLAGCRFPGSTAADSSSSSHPSFRVLAHRIRAVSACYGQVGYHALWPGKVTVSWKGGGSSTVLLVTPGSFAHV